MILHAEEDFRILTYITTDVDGIKTWVLIDTVLPGVLLKPSIDVVGSSNPNQMRWPRETYASTRRSFFHASVASFFIWHVKRCACGHPRPFRFCKKSEFGSRWPDVMVSVSLLTQVDPTLSLEGAKRHVATKSWNSLSACFCGCVSSMQHKKFFRSTIFCYE